MQRAGMGKEKPSQQLIIPQDLLLELVLMNIFSNGLASGMEQTRGVVRWY